MKQPKSSQIQPGDLDGSEPAGNVSDSQSVSPALARLESSPRAERASRRTPSTVIADVGAEWTRKMHVELIDDVSDDTRLVRTKRKLDPMPLAVAIVSEVMALAENKNWPELMDWNQLEFSAKGAHLVGLRLRYGDGYPWLMTSTLVHAIEDWQAGPPRNFTVMREPYFRTQQFPPWCGPGKLEDAIKGIDGWEEVRDRLSIIDARPKATDDFIENLIYAFKPWKPAAMDRATVAVNSPDRFGDLYDTFIRGCELLRNRGSRVCVGVTYERPFIDILRVLETLSQTTCFKIITQGESKKSEPPLFGTLVLLDNTVQAARSVTSEVIKKNLWIKKNR
jgi:hypothetical protein